LNSDQQLRKTIEDLRELERNCFASRSRFAFYDYLAAVFELYVQLRRRNEAKASARRIAELFGLRRPNGTHPIRVIIDATSTADIKTIMQEAQNDLNKRRAEHASILAGRARIIQLFEQYQDQLERAGNALLSKYRTTNRQTRSSPAPNRFDEHWVIERIPVPFEPPDFVGNELDQEIRKSQEVLRIVEEAAVW
jgi:hypothetical protein